MNVIIDLVSFPTLEAQSQLFKALAHPARLAIVFALRDGEHCVCHLEAHLGLRQAYLSQQLSVLREAGLVDLRRDGWNSYYHVTHPEVFALLDGFQTLLPQGSLVFQIIPKPACPCPCCSSRRNEAEA